VYGTAGKATPFDVTTKSAEPSAPAGVTHVTVLAVTAVTSQASPPASTVVSSILPLNPFPAITTVCPPNVLPVSGLIESAIA